MLDFERWQRFTSPNSNDNSEPTWLRRTWSLLWDNLAPLVLITLAGTLLAAPVIVLGMTIGFFGLLVAVGIVVPLIFGGLMAAVSAEWRVKTGSMRDHAIAAVKRQWLPLIVLGLIAAVGAGASLITTSQILAGGSSGTLLLLWFAQSGMLVFLASLLIYALPLTATRDLGPRLALRNAMVLLLTAPLPTIGVLALIVACLVLMLWFGLGLWLIVPSLLSVVITTNCEAQIERLDAAGRST